MLRALAIFLATICLLSCKKVDKVSCVPAPLNSSGIVEYLHIGHTRTDINPDVVPEALTIDYKYYELLMHGGDVSFYTALDSSTIRYGDSIFDFSSDSTLLALGNHEYQDTALLMSMTYLIFSASMQFKHR